MTVLCEGEYKALIRIIRFAASRWSKETDRDFVEVCDKALAGNKLALDELIAFGSAECIRRAELVAEEEDEEPDTVRNPVTSLLPGNKWAEEFWFRFDKGTPVTAGWSGTIRMSFKQQMFCIEQAAHEHGLTNEGYNHCHQPPHLEGKDLTVRSLRILS